MIENFLSPSSGPMSTDPDTGPDDEDTASNRNVGLQINIEPVDGPRLFYNIYAL
jgi:hypothetical protein